VIVSVGFEPEQALLDCAVFLQKRKKFAKNYFNYFLIPVCRRKIPPKSGSSSCANGQSRSEISNPDVPPGKAGGNWGKLMRSRKIGPGFGES
jgi:hypothetical protein